MTSPEIPTVPSDMEEAIIASEPVGTAAAAGGRGRIRNYFLTGLVVAGPVAITIYLIWSFVTWVDGLVRPFIPPAALISSAASWMPITA